MPQQPMFVCNVGALSNAERKRHRHLLDKFRSARQNTRELPHGYAYQLSSAMMSLTETIEWIEAERRCCPFLEFAIDIPAGGPLGVSISGPAGVKPFIEGELG